MAKKSKYASQNEVAARSPKDRGYDLAQPNADPRGADPDEMNASPSAMISTRP